MPRRHIPTYYHCIESVHANLCRTVVTGSGTPVPAEHAPFSTTHSIQNMPHSLHVHNFMQFFQNMPYSLHVHNCSPSEHAPLTTCTQLHAVFSEHALFTTCTQLQSFRTCPTHYMNITSEQSEDTGWKWCTSVPRKGLREAYTQLIRITPTKLFPSLYVRPLLTRFLNLVITTQP